MDVDERVAVGSSRSVSSKLDAASKPQLIALLTKQMTRVKEAERRAAELSEQLEALRTQREQQQQADRQQQVEHSTEAEGTVKAESPQSTHTQTAPPRQEAQPRSDSVAALPLQSTAAAIDDEQHRLLSVDVLELRHAAVVRSYEDRLSALNGTLVKYKGVTAKLHDKLKAMAEQIKLTSIEQAMAAAQQSEAERVIQSRADEMAVMLEVVEAVMGNRERAQWEAEMRREKEEAVKAATERGSGRSESEQQQEQQPDEVEAAGRTSAHQAGPTSINGVERTVAVDGSLFRLSRLLAAVQRQSGEVRRMKEESLSQLLALSQAQQTTQHKSAAHSSLHTDIRALVTQQ